jgi:hypothetical protein
VFQTFFPTPLGHFSNTAFGSVCFFSSKHFKVFFCFSNSAFDRLLRGKKSIVGGRLKL